MSTPSVFKAPGASLGLPVDWSDWLEGDVIAASVWRVAGGESPSPLELSEDEISGSPASATFARADGGVAGENYLVENEITTAVGDKEVRAFRVYCREAA